jgi:hypothetical protein
MREIGDAVASIESDVMATFIARLKAADDVGVSAAEELSNALAQEKLPKPEELAALYSAASGDPLA